MEDLESASSLANISFLDISLLLILFLASAFFSSAETAYLSVNRYKLESKAKEGVRSAKIALKLLEDPQKLVTTILIGNNLVNIAAASISTNIAIKIFGSLGVGIATGIVTILTLVFGEVIPKNFAINHSYRLVLLYSRILYILEILFTPISYFLIKLTHKIVGNEKVESKITEEEIRLIVEHGVREGAIEKEEKELIKNILDFDETTVDEIMTPRTKIVAIDEDETLDKALDLIIKSSYSKLPVYKDSIDNITGVIYLKDVLKNIKNKKMKVKKIARKTLFVPESKKVPDLFKEMKKNKVKMAIVIDEYGGVAGIVTLEDIINAILGNINKDSKKDIVKVKDNVYYINPQLNISFLEELVGMDLSDDDYNTLSGLIMHKLQRIPKEGDKVLIKNIELKVEEINNKEIKKVRLKILNNKDPKKDEQ